jgi:hypothetical protein
MKSPLALAIALLVVAGCGPEPVEGIWKGTIQVQEKEGRIQRQANRIGNPVLELKSDKSFTLSAGIQIAGTWAETGNELNFKVEKVNDEPAANLAPLIGLDREDLTIKARLSDDRRKITIDTIPRVPGSVEFMR